MQKVVPVMLVALVTLCARGQTYDALSSGNFQELVGPSGVIPQGFGDRQNSAPYSMAWFKGNLYIGTNRAYHCMEEAALARSLPWLFTYPAPGLDVECPGAPDPLALPLQAEIWRWSPLTRNWLRVYQSPADAPSGVTGRTVARDVGYRAMYVFREADGTEALYVSGVSSKWVFGNPSSARILRTVDGTNFSAIPQDPGTFLGDLGNASFRGMTSLRNKLYIIAGNINGYGRVLESADPAKGNNSFRPVSPAGIEFLEIETFNGFLYMGSNDERGFELYKTAALASQSDGTYPLTKIIPYGGHVAFSPNRAVISLKEFRGRLYVGCDAVWSFTAAEMYRVNPDDSWDVVSGTGRDTPAGRKEPISGLGPGFGWQLNAHMWRQAVYDNRLYVGTFDFSTMLKDTPLINLLVAPFMGGDLWRSDDGVYFAEVHTTGFGDTFSYGIRTMEPTPYGLFIAFANFYYGLRVRLGVPNGFTPPAPAIQAPQRLDAEMVRGKNLLSWETSPGATQYQVFRSLSTNQSVQVSGVSGQVWTPGSFLQAGVTDKTVFTDLNVDPASRYAYYVVARGANGSLSRPSNRAETPLTKGTTFSAVTDMVWRLTFGGKFVTAQAAFYFLTETDRAKQELFKGNPAPLRNLWLAARTNTAQGGPLLDRFSAEDLELKLSRLLKRASLFQSGQLVQSDL